MSGLACEIILHGNFAQALLRTAVALTPATPSASGMYLPNVNPAAERAIANSVSICQLGTLTYDGAEAMNDDQQQTGTDLMHALIVGIRATIESAARRGVFSAGEKFKVDTLIEQYNTRAEALLADVGGIPYPPVL